MRRKNSKRTELYDKPKKIHKLKVTVDRKKSFFLLRQLYTIIFVTESQERPENIQALLVLSDLISLRWSFMINPNDNVLYQGFKVQYRMVGRVGDWSVVTVYGIDKRSLVLSGMRPGLSYEVIVRASSDRSEGNPSHPVIITTLESGELNSSSKLWSHGLLSSTEL